MDALNTYFSTPSPAIQIQKDYLTRPGYWIASSGGIVYVVDETSGTLVWSGAFSSLDPKGNYIDVADYPYVEMQGDQVQFGDSPFPWNPNAGSGVVAPGATPNAPGMTPGANPGSATPATGPVTLADIPTQARPYFNADGSLATQVVGGVTTPLADIVTDDKNIYLADFETGVYIGEFSYIPGIVDAWPGIKYAQYVEPVVNGAGIAILVAQSTPITQAQINAIAAEGAPVTNVATGNPAAATTPQTPVASISQATGLSSTAVIAIGIGAVALLVLR